MSETYVFFTVSGALKSGLQGEIEEIPENIRRAAMRAVNKTADRARAASAREMRNQVNFPARYLSSEGRLQVTRKASLNNLEAVVTGRQAPTSLARFVKSSAKGRTMVEVKPGAAVRLGGKPGSNIRSSFLMKLKNSNQGLAVRTSGGKPDGAYKPKMIAPNLYLLYGPAVDQVFRTVADDVSEPMADYLEGEFTRLLDLGDLI